MIHGVVHRMDALRMFSLLVWSVYYGLYTLDYILWIVYYGPHSLQLPFGGLESRGLWRIPKSLEEHRSLEEHWSPMPTNESDTRIYDTIRPITQLPNPWWIKRSSAGRDLFLPMLMPRAQRFWQVRRRRSNSVKFTPNSRPKFIPRDSHCPRLGCARRPAGEEHTRRRAY